MKKILILATLLSFSSYGAEWDTVDRTLGATALAATVIDWRQTQQIAESPTVYYEHNPIIGIHPNMKRVNSYFLGYILITGLIADTLPSDYRKAFLAGYTTVEIATVGHNLQLGIGFKF